MTRKPDEVQERFGRLRVLIVEDNVIDRELLKVHLKNLGITYVHEAANGHEANFKVENATRVGKPFHLVITDWKMPNKDGLSLTRHLRSSSHRQNIAILMITSIAERKQVMEAISEVDEFLIKPIDPKILSQKILTLVQIMDSAPHQKEKRNA